MPSAIAQTIMWGAYGAALAAAGTRHFALTGVLWLAGTIAAVRT